MAEELQTGADGKDDDALVGRFTKREPFVLQIIRRDGHFDVLAALDEDHVECCEIGRLTHLDRHDGRRDPAPSRTALDRAEVPAISGNVEQRRIEVGDPDHWVVEV